MATARPGMQDGRALTCYMQSSDINSRLKTLVGASDSTQFRYILQKDGQKMSEVTAAQLARQTAQNLCNNPTAQFGCMPYK